MTPHEHRRTILGIERTNLGAIKWTAILGALALIFNGLNVAFDKGMLVPPPAILVYWPYVTFVGDVVGIVAAALGIPSLHPDVPMDALHHGPIERHHE